MEWEWKTSNNLWDIDESMLFCTQENTVSIICGLPCILCILHFLQWIRNLSKLIMIHTLWGILFHFHCLSWIQSRTDQHKRYQDRSYWISKTSVSKNAKWRKTEVNWGLSQTHWFLYYQVSAAASSIWTGHSSCSCQRTKSDNWMR